MSALSLPAVDFDGLKRLAKQFHDALATATPEEADAGFKCFVLSWFAFEPARPGEEVQAAALLKIVSRDMLAFEARRSGGL